jgi:hypothetical protein
VADMQVQYHKNCDGFYVGDVAWVTAERAHDLICSSIVRLCPVAETADARPRLHSDEGRHDQDNLMAAEGIQVLKDFLDSWQRKYGSLHSSFPDGGKDRPCSEGRLNGG